MNIAFSIDSSAVICVIIISYQDIYLNLNLHLYANLSSKSIYDEISINTHALTIWHKIQILSYFNWINQQIIRLIYALYIAYLLAGQYHLLLNTHLIKHV